MWSPSQGQECLFTYGRGDGWPSVGHKSIVAFYQANLLTKLRLKQKAAAKLTDPSLSSHFSCCPLWSSPSPALKEELASVWLPRKERAQVGEEEAGTFSELALDHFPPPSDEQPDGPGSY